MKQPHRSHLVAPLGTAATRRGRRAAARFVVRLAVAVVVAFTGFPHAVAAASPLCVTATGTVYDIYGVPLPNATITLPHPDCGVSGTTADAQGRYQIPVQSTASEQANASKPGYETGIVFVRFNPAGGTENDFALRYGFVAAAVSPYAVQPGATTTLSAKVLPSGPPAADGFVCEWGWSDVHGVELHRSYPVPGIGGTGTLSGATAVASGVDFNLAVLADATVVSWGGNVAGDLGDGSRTDWFTRPPDRVVAVGGGGVLSNVTQVAAGSFHGLARLGDGTVAAWGANWNMQLGVASPDESPTPLVVPSLTGTGPLTGVRAVAAGGEQSVALLEDGRVVRWGHTQNGALGRVSGPELVRDVTGQVLTDVVAIDAGDGHAMALRNDGTVVAWGSNAAGQLGNPGVTGSFDGVSVVGFNGTGVLSGVTGIAAGASHSLVRLADATAGAWGAAQYGQLGDGAASPVAGTVPRRVVAESGSGTATGVAAVFAAGHHSFALLTSGITLAWGDNSVGQLGDDTSTNSAVPIRPKGGGGNGVLAGIDTLTGDWANSVAIRSGPCGQDRAPTRMWMQTGTGASATMTALSAGTPDAQGYTTWTAPVTGSGTDGLRSVRLCILDRRATDTCDQAVLAGPLRGASPIRTVYYVVDGTAPVLASTTPTAFATMLGLTTVAVSWTDPGAGVRSSTITMTLDGQPVTPTTLGGGYAAISAAGLAPGIHRVTSTAADLAGNIAAERSFIFTLATLDADPATATVEQTTLDVNPNGAVVPPSTITFPRPRVNVSGFAEQLSASTRVGYGTVNRSFTFASNTLVVRFDNGALTVDQPIAAAHTGTADHKLAVLAPSAVPLAGRVQPSTTNLADITVSVPVGFNTPGSTATLLEKNAPLGGGTAANHDPLGSKLPPDQLVVNATLTACRERSTDPASNGFCQQTPLPEAQVTIAGVGDIVTVLPFSINPPDPDDYASTAPLCNQVNIPAEGGCDDTLSEEVHSVMSLGCPVVAIGIEPINLCTAAGIEPHSPDYGFLAAYVNEFVYAGPTDSSAVLTQNHVEAPSGGERCPVGDSGAVKATVHRASTTITDLNGKLPAAVAGTVRDDDTTTTSQLTVKLGEETGPDQHSILDDSGSHPRYTIDAARLYQIDTAWNITPRTATEGTYGIRIGVRDDLTGTPQNDPASINNAFHAANAGITGTLALGSGAIYSDPANIAYLASLVFQFTADFTECHP